MDANKWSSICPTFYFWMRSFYTSNMFKIMMQLIVPNKNYVLQYKSPMISQYDLYWPMVKCIQVYHWSFVLYDVISCILNNSKKLSGEYFLLDPSQNSYKLSLDMGSFTLNDIGPDKFPFFVRITNLRN